MAVPPRYDLINLLITWGRDDVWRQRAARECLALHPERVLDLCCGTGKLAMRMARIADTSTSIMGLDYSLPMLKLAVTAMERNQVNDRTSFIHGDVADLPFPDNYFDSAGIAFAFRNITYKNPLTPRYLKEILRVLKPEGRFVIVESSQPKTGLIRKLFHIYMRSFVFRIGSILSGNRGAYHYLAESAARFYTPDELRNLLLSSGFSRFSTRPMMFGTIGLHTAIK